VCTGKGVKVVHARPAQQGLARPAGARAAASAAVQASLSASVIFSLTPLRYPSLFTSIESIAHDWGSDLCCSNLYESVPICSSKAYDGY
jgi:hypothetical protein